jgi:hypothetical protein
METFLDKFVGGIGVGKEAKAVRINRNSEDLATADSTPEQAADMGDRHVTP